MDGFVKGGRFGVLVDGGELSYCLRMVDLLYLLFDDGVFVEVDSDEVGCCVNEFDFVGMGLVVWVGIFEIG